MNQSLSPAASKAANSIKHPLGRRVPWWLTAHAWLAGAAGAVAALPSIAGATEPDAPRRAYDIAPGALQDSLHRFAQLAGITLSFTPEQVVGLYAPRLQGSYSIDEGLSELLQVHALEARRTRDGAYALHATASARGATLGRVQVSGTRDHGLSARTQDTATKTQMTLRETPQAITVTTRDSMDARQVRDKTSALELTAGVTASNESTLGGPFAGRGLSSGEEFTLRGVSLSSLRDVRIDGFASAAAQFDLAAFERLEVVKGPSSMLYGQGSLGGFINLVRKPAHAERTATVSVQVGSFNTYRAEADVAGAIDAEQRWLARVTAVRDSSESFIDGVKTDVAMLAPTLEGRLTPDTRLQFQLLYQRDDFIPSHGIPLRVDGPNLRIPDVPRSRFTGVPSRDDSHAENALSSVRLDHKVSDRWAAGLMLQTSRQNFRRYFDNYVHGDLSPEGNATLYADTSVGKNDLWAGELRLDGRFEAFGREHRATFGLERNRRSERGGFAYQAVGTGNIYTPDFTSAYTGPLARDLVIPGDVSNSSNNAAAYAQGMFKLTDRTQFLLGVRADQAKQSNFDHLSGTGESNTKRATTKRFGLTHDATREVTFYASYGESFNPVSDRAADDHILDPERGRGYELGVKSEWFNKRLSAAGALYRQYLVNRPIPDPDHPNFSVSGGKQRIQGVELEVLGSPIPSIDIGAVAAWTQGRYVDPNDDHYGLTPYGLVDRNASLYASYRFGDGVLRGVRIGGMLVHVGRRSFASPGMGDYLGIGTDELSLKGYERFDLNLGYEALPGWKLSLQIRNVFDTTYIERVRDIKSNNYFGSPRALLLRAEYTFR